jgi:hypothetical protein
LLPAYCCADAPYAPAAGAGSSKPRLRADHSCQVSHRRENKALYRLPNTSDCILAQVIYEQEDLKDLIEMVVLPLLALITAEGHPQDSW